MKPFLVIISLICIIGIAWGQTSFSGSPYSINYPAFAPSAGCDAGQFQTGTSSSGNTTCETLSEAWAPTWRCIVVPPGGGAGSVSLDATGCLAPNTDGTISNPLPTSGGVWNLQTNRTELKGTAIGPAGLRFTYGRVWRGDVAGQGGFNFRARWFHAEAPGGARIMVGLNTTAGARATQDPSVDLETIYAGVDSTQDAYSLCSNDASGTATCAACGSAYRSISTTNVFELVIEAAPNASSVRMRLSRVDNPSIAPCTATISSDLPLSTTMLIARATFQTVGDGGSSHVGILGVWIEGP